jgi:hypothetical protein
MAQARATRRSYNIHMNKTLFVAAVLALCAASVSAQNYDGMFGMTSSDMQAMVARAKADARLAYLKELGMKDDRWPSIGKLIGTTKTLASAQNCVWDAAISHAGVEIRSADWPAVLFGSNVDGDRYRAAVTHQYPDKSVDGIQTIYVSDYNVIYVDDSASDYKDGATMDDALAGEFTRWIDVTQKDIRDQAKLDADAAAASAWYRATYPAGASSCR